MKRIFWIILIGLCVACFAGCSASEFQSTVQDANSPFQTAADSTGIVLEALKPLSPMVAAMPYGQFILAGFAALSTIVNGIQSMKSKRQSKAISQTVFAVEQFKSTADKAAVDALKSALADAQSPESKLICYAVRQGV